MRLAGPLAGVEGSANAVLGDVNYPAGSTPAEILGTKLHTWLRANDAGDFTLDDATDVVAWTNRGGTGNPAQATDALQPTFEVDCVKGKPGVLFSRSAGEYLTVVLGTPIAAASRPYAWVVLKPVTTVNGDIPFLFQNDATDSTFYLTANATNWRMHANLGAAGALEQINGPVLDANPHLFELGALATTTAKFVVDGVGFNGSGTGAIPGDMTRMSLCTLEFGGTFFQLGDARIADVVVAGSLPTTAQVLAMRAYYRNRYQLSVA